MKKTLPPENLDSPRKNVSFLVISLILHIILFFGFYSYQQLFPSHQAELQKEEDLGVQFIDISQMPNPHGQLVEQDENEKASKEKPLDAKYSSKVDKKVEKETRAAHRGDLQNVAKQPAQQQSSPSQNSPAQTAQRQEAAPSSDESTMKTFEGGDFAIPSAAKKHKKAVSISDLRPNSFQDMSQNALASVSQTNDYLKDVAIGAETHLNTREFLYYSYFNRIKKKLRQHWEPLVHAKVRMIMKKGRDIASTGSKATRVIITLDDQGGLTRVQVATTSGLEDLDDAALDALKEAAPFPNPPKDLIEDGYVKLNWDFILES